MKRKATSAKDLQFQQPAFRLRAVTLALLALSAGILALVLALTKPPTPSFFVERSAPVSPEWPPGFVELELGSSGVDVARSAARTASPSPSSRPAQGAPSLRSSSTEAPRGVPSSR